MQSAKNWKKNKKNWKKYINQLLQEFIKKVDHLECQAKVNKTLNLKDRDKGLKEAKDPQWMM